MLQTEIPMHAARLTCGATIPRMTDNNQISTFYSTKHV